MLNPVTEEIAEIVETSEPAPESPAAVTTRPQAGKPKPRAPKPKSVTPQPVQSDGPIYLLLSANGKYKELREPELEIEAAGIFKDPTLRLVKAQFMVPQISFKVSEE